MKTRFTAIVALFIMFATFGASAAVDLNGKHYQGIGKIKGQPIDCWVDMNFDDTDIEFNVSDAYKFGASYTAKAVGDKVTVTAKVPGAVATTLTSTDGGSTFQGNISLNGQALNLWVLNVPAKIKPSEKPAAELESVIGDPDGYTAFVLVSLPGGQQMCATSEFAFNGGDKTFRMTCDSPSLQKIFGNMQGSYTVDGSEIVMTDSTGKTVRGSICDDGYYLKIPMGSAQGITLTFVLIK